MYNSEVSTNVLILFLPSKEEQLQESKGKCTSLVIECEC